MVIRIRGDPLGMTDQEKREVVKGDSNPHEIRTQRHFHNKQVMEDALAHRRGHL